MLPRKPFENGDLAKDEDLVPPRPRALIRYLDELARKREGQHNKQVVAKALRDKRIRDWIVENQSLNLEEMFELLREHPDISVRWRQLKRHHRQFLRRKELAQADTSG